MSAQKKLIPMQAFTYLVKVVTGSKESAKESTVVWNSKTPMVVGHPMRWELSQSEDGVKVSARWTDTEHFVKESEIAKGKASVRLVCSPKDSGRDAISIRVEILPVAKLAAAFTQAPTLGSSLKIFHCIGDWAVESVALEGTYVGKHGGKKVFKLKAAPAEGTDGIFLPNSIIEVKALTGGITVYAKTAEKLAKGETRRFRFCDISGVKLGYEGSEWRLASFAKSSDPAFLAAPIDPEAGLYKRAFIGAVAASLLLGLISFLVPAPQPIAKVETINIKLAKKKVVRGMMTAAPTGDPSARDFSIGKSGSAKNAGKKGALADSKKVAPAGKSQKVAQSAAKSAPKKSARPAPAKTVAMKKSSPKPAVAKTAVKASPKKVAASRVAPAASARGLKKVAVAARPAPVPHTELFKTLSSASFQRTAKGLAAGGASAGATGGSASDAHRLGSANGSGRGDLGGTGGVETRSASVSGFGGGGSGDGDGGPGSRGAGYGRGSNSKVSGQGRSFVSMDTGASDVEEGLTRDQVGKVIYAHRNEIRYCLDSATLRSADIGGRMMAKFAVNAAGNVSTAGVGASSVNDRRLHECVLSRLKGMKFPKPKGGVTVAVAYPFDFKTL